MQTASHLLQHIFVSLVGRLRRHISERYRIGKTDTVVGDSRESLIHIIIDNLIVHSVIPVFFGHLGMLRIHVAGNIEFTPYMPHFIPCVSFRLRMMCVNRSSYSRFEYTLLQQQRSLHRSRSWFVIVVHNIGLHSLSPVTTLVTPIINHVVTDIHPLFILCSDRRSQTWCTRGIVSHEIMMKRSIASAPYTAITMGALVMTRIDETLSGNTPLHRVAVTAIHRDTLIDTPTDRTMVDNHIVMIMTFQSVALMKSHIPITQPETHISDNDII